MSRLISMKVKAALAGAAVLAGVGFAGTAFAQGNDGSAGDGDLFLVVYDSTAGQSYVEDLGVTTAAVATDAAVQTAAEAATGGKLSTSLPGYTATFNPDSTLSGWLSGHTGDTYQWEVLANTGPTSSPPADGAGKNLLLTTDAKTVPASFTNLTGGFNNGNVNANTLNLQGDIDNWITNSTFAANGVNANSGSTAFTNTSTLPGQSLDKAALTWYGNGDVPPAITWKPSSGTSTSNFYLATDANSNNGNSQLFADIFNLGTVSLAANGVLSFAAGTVSAVPLPAAVWLLGSGLLGLAGVARRRTAAA